MNKDIIIHQKGEDDLPKQRTISAGAGMLIGTDEAGKVTSFTPEEARENLGLVGAVITEPLYLAFNFLQGQQKLAIGLTADGQHIKLFNSPAWSAPVAGDIVRDPSVILHTDGYFYVAVTAGGLSNVKNYFNIIRSKDLVTWTLHVEVEVYPEPIVAYTWAPKFFVDPADGTVHVFYCDGFLKHIVADDATLLTWSDPEPIPLASDPGGIAGGIDPYVFFVSGSYYMFRSSNDGAELNINLLKASSVEGPWTQNRAGDFLDTGTVQEAGFPMRLPDNRWRIYFYIPDGGEDGIKYRMAESLGTNIETTTFNEARPVLPYPSSPRDYFTHGTMLEVSTVDTMRLALGLMTTAAPLVPSPPRQGRGLWNIAVNSGVVNVVGSGEGTPVAGAWRLGTGSTTGSSALWRPNNNGFISFGTGNFGAGVDFRQPVWLCFSGQIQLNTLGVARFQLGRVYNQTTVIDFPATANDGMGVIFRSGNIYVESVNESTRHESAAVGTYPTDAAFWYSVALYSDGQGGMRVWINNVEALPLVNGPMMLGSNDNRGLHISVSNGAGTDYCLIDICQDQIIVAVD